jgi:hypothetical protein
VQRKAKAFYRTKFTPPCDHCYWSIQALNAQTTKEQAEDALDAADPESSTYWMFQQAVTNAMAYEIYAWDCVDAYTCTCVVSPPPLPTQVPTQVPTQ